MYRNRKDYRLGKNLLQRRKYLLKNIVTKNLPYYSDKISKFVESLIRIHHEYLYTICFYCSCPNCGNSIHS